jgi:hypothetical protein
VHQHRSSGGRLELIDSSHVIDMRMSGNNVLHPKLVLRQNLLDLLDVVARIDYYRFARGLITKDGTITGQHSHRKDFVNHGRRATFHNWIAASSEIP